MENQTNPQSKQPKKRRKFSKKEKLQVLTEAKQNGTKVTLEKYDLYPATYYYWRKQFLAEGNDGLDHKVNKAHRSRIKALEKELQTYKIMLAEEQLKVRMQQEMIKKKYPELS